MKNMNAKRPPPDTRLATLRQWTREQGHRNQPPTGRRQGLPLSPRRYCHAGSCRVNGRSSGCRRRSGGDDLGGIESVDRIVFSKCSCKHGDSTGIEAGVAM